MNKTLVALLLASFFAMTQSVIHAAPGSSAPLYQVTVVQNPAKAINYRKLSGSAEIVFKGTVLIPAAKGKATIKNKSGALEIKADFDKLSTPTQFGSEYLTYVLWAISPDGRATNLGELIVKDEKSELNAKTSLQTLTLLVTAEPYFAVTQPSNVVVLENALRPDNKDKIEMVDAKYELLPRGEYTKNLATTEIKPTVMDKKTPFYVFQARNAVTIAKAAGAETYATDGFKNAERLLAIAETKEGGKKGRTMTAREAVQAAEDSRLVAVQKQNEESLSMERQQSKEQITKARTEALTASEQRAKAEEARQMAEQERAASLALAANATAASSDAQAEAKRAREAADQAKAEAMAANAKAQQAEGQEAALRAQLLTQFNAILQTRDTARGLIVNMSGALFQTGSANLQPPVREKLAKIAGIVASHPGLKLSIEGHTDNVGSDEANQRLSEKRAQSARDYLVSQGVASDAVTSQGFGETAPIQSNDTAQGRQANRRVEIIVSGDSIGTTVGPR